jgi:DNA-damage-inducible protein J
MAKFPFAMRPQPGHNCFMSKTAKQEVEGILAELGLTASETVHLLYRQIKLQRGLPFEVRIPNPLTARTLRASQSGKGVKRFRTKQELCGDLGL